MTGTAQPGTIGRGRMWLQALGVTAILTAVAAREYALAERRSRGAWAAQYGESVQGAPYRESGEVAPTASTPSTSKAPVVVRVTAFACIVLGPLTIAMMFVWLITRSASLLSTALRKDTADDTHLASADSLHRLASLLLARDRRVPLACDVVT